MTKPKQRQRTTNARKMQKPKQHIGHNNERPNKKLKPQPRQKQPLRKEPVKQRNRQQLNGKPRQRQPGRPKKPPPTQHELNLPQMQQTRTESASKKSELTPQSLKPHHQREPTTKRR